MRRALSKLVAACLLWLLFLAFVPSNRYRELSPVSSQGTAPVDWSTLRTALEQRADFYRFVSQLPPPTTATTQRPRSLEVVYGSGACGGDLPPCSVLRCESGGNLVAQNPRSTASGKWQILDSTWAGFGGYERALYAPESVQDDKARLIYRNGAGRSAWVC